YKGHNLPFYINRTAITWVPLLGIGQSGGWLNTYQGKAQPAYITQIQALLNQKLAPAMVAKYIGTNSSGVQLPLAGAGAYSVINAEFSGGVVQTYNGKLSGADKVLHDNNYNKIQAIK
ncbi:MAG: hypothetical protein ACLRFN_01415, partial [Alphaproteobacteria bacterium]